MSNAIQGQLGEGVLANLLQYLSFNQASGCLSLRQGDHQGDIYFESGNVVHIVSDSAVGVGALAQLLNWTTGQFRFQSKIESPRKTIKISVDRLLLQASYQSDVDAMDPRQRLSETSVLVPAPMSSKDPQTIEMTLLAVQMLRHLDGHHDVSDVARLLELPVQDALDAAYGLFEKGLVELVDEPSTEKVAEVWGLALKRFEDYVEARRPGTFEKAWSKVCNHLADDYPALDPFAPDIVYEDGKLILEVDDLEPDEFTDALVLAVQHLARLFRIPPEEIPAVVESDSLGPSYLLEAAQLSRLLKRSS